MNIKYLIGKMIAMPLLPIMYFQAKNIRATIPKLPEAKGSTGVVNIGAQKSLNMLVIGESTVAGVGVENHDEGFSGTLARELAKANDSNVNWKVYAKSGYTAKKVADYIVDKIGEKEIDLIVVGLGGNDAFTLNSPKRWSLHILELVNKLRTKFGEVPIVFTNMPPIKEFPAFTSLIKFVIGNLVEILGKTLQHITKNDDNLFYNAEIITVAGWVKKLNLKEDKKDFFSDGVHPSKFTYQVWAKDLSGFIIENVKFNG